MRLLLLLWLPLFASEGPPKAGDDAATKSLSDDSNQAVDDEDAEKARLLKQLLKEKKGDAESKPKDEKAEKEKRKRLSKLQNPPQQPQTPPPQTPQAPGVVEGASAGPTSVDRGSYGPATAAPSEQALRSQQDAAKALNSNTKQTLSRMKNAASGFRQVMPQLDGEGGAGNLPGAADPLRDLAAAQAGGSGYAFRELGLQARADAAGRMQLMRADGAAATASDVAALRQRLAAQPEALGRYPSFYQAIEPRRFDQLKDDFRGATPAERAGVFRDVAMSSSERDFLWSRSCSSVSGDCNPRSSALSYDKGAFVPPADLKEMHEELHPEKSEELEDFLSGSEYSEEEEKEASQAIAAVAGPRGGMLARMGLGNLLSKIGFDSAPSEAGTAGEASAQEASAIPVGGAGAAPGAHAPAARGSGEGAYVLTYRDEGLSTQKNGAGAPKESPAPLLPRLLAGLGLCLLAFGLLRRRR